MNTTMHLHANRLSGVLAMGAGLLLLGSPMARAADNNPTITMIVAKRGTMVMELYPDAAPKTVAHILALVKSKFYDGIKIHRVVPAFVVQWGDPVSKTLSPDQFDANNVGAHDSGSPVPLEAKLSNDKNTLGLARSQDPNSGDCQIYINLKNNTALNGGYCVFGKVVKGAELAEKLQKGDVITSVRLGGKADKAGKASKTAHR